MGNGREQNGSGSSQARNPRRVGWAVLSIEKRLFSTACDDACGLCKGQENIWDCRGQSEAKFHQSLFCLQFRRLQADKWQRFLVCVFLKVSPK